MIQVKKLDVNLGYSDRRIEDLINDWLKNTTGIEVQDIKYNVTDSGYESVLIIYEKI